MILGGEIKDGKMSSFSSGFQTLKHEFPLYFLYELLMSLRINQTEYPNINILIISLYGRQLVK